MLLCCYEDGWLCAILFQFLVLIQVIWDLPDQSFTPVFPCGDRRSPFSQSEAQIHKVLLKCEMWINCSYLWLLAHLCGFTLYQTLSLCLKLTLKVFKTSLTRRSVFYLSSVCKWKIHRSFTLHHLWLTITLMNGLYIFYKSFEFWIDCCTSLK